MISFSILKLKDFRRLWIGQAATQFGDSMYLLIFLFMVERLTGNPAMVGFVAGVQALPYIVLSPYAGVLADRVDRRTLMVASDVGSAAVMLAFAAYLAAVPKPDIVVIFVVAGSLATLNVFFAPARAAAVPRLVPPERLQEANGLSLATQNFMPLLGIGLSGVLLGAIERTAPQAFFLAAVLTNGLTFVFSATCFLRLPQIVPLREEIEDKHPLTDLREGWDYIRAHSVVRMMALLGFLMNLFISPFMLVYVAVNSAWFGGMYWTLASFEGSFVGAMLLASLVAMRLPIRRPGLAYCLAIGGCGVLVAALGEAPYFWPFLLLNLACGLLLPLGTLPMQTYLQLIIPDAYMGRVQSFIVMLSMAVVPFSNFLAGLLLKMWGPTTIFYLMGGGLLAAALLGLATRAFRSAEMPVHLGNR